MKNKSLNFFYLVVVKISLVLCSNCLAVAAQTNGYDGQAIVYFYSYATTTTLGRVKKPVFLDDAEIAQIRPERFFIALVEPGKHTFRLKNKKFGGIEMDFEAGKTYYIRINWESEGKLKPAGIVLMPPESGAYDIKQLRPVGRENIKDQSRIFLKISDAERQ